MRQGTVVIAVALLAGACSERLAAPVVKKVEPSAGYTGEDVRVMIYGENFHASAFSRIDTGEMEVDLHFDVTLTPTSGSDPTHLAKVRFINTETLEGTVPASLAPGPYDATVMGPRGNSPRHEDAYEALLCADADADRTCDIEDPCVDVDGDGACLPGDCDDDLAGCGAGCFPGNTAKDLLDGHDQDCDGALDEDADTMAPIITLVGEPTVHAEQGLGYVDAGATAADDVDGDLTSQIVVVSNVDTSAAGRYVVTFDVSDSAGNAAVQVQRAVDVADTTAPVISRIGAASVEAAWGIPYLDAGATATDSIDGDLSAGIVTYNPVDTAAAGDYVVTYDVSDAAGNAATQVTRTVTVVVVDTTNPIITLLGDDPTWVAQDRAYADAGVEAHDDVDGDITSQVIKAGSVDTAVLGAYTLSYEVSDAAGNSAASISRRVFVIYDCAAAGVGTRPLEENVQALGAQTAHVVCSFGQLEEVGSDPADTALAATYVLGADIDASTTRSGYDGGSGWRPIGTCGAGDCSDGDEDPFTGIFLGAGHAVTELFIDRTGTWGVGLFGKTEGAAIEALRMVEADIRGYRYVGVLVGWATASTEVSRCNTTGDIAADYGDGGGVVGYLTNLATLSRSSSSVRVTGQWRLGGLVGQTASGFIEDSFATGDVSGVRYAGGIVGVDVNGETHRCYATGSVSCARSTGGIVGQTSGPGSIVGDSFTASDVEGNASVDEEVGAVVGHSYGIATAEVYYDATAVVTNLGTGALRTGIGTAREPEGADAADYFFLATNPPLSAWDFDGVWVENPTGYPTLR